MHNPPYILFVDDDPVTRDLILDVLGPDEYNVVTVEDASGTRERIEEAEPDVLILDLRLPDEDGLSLLGDLSVKYPNLPIILQTGHANMDIAVEALRRGVFDFIRKPLTTQTIRMSVMRALRFREVAEERTMYIQLLEQTNEMLMASYRKVLEMEERVSMVDLIKGVEAEAHSPINAIFTGEEPISLDLGTLIEATVAETRSILNLEGIVVDVKIAEGLPHINARPRQLEDLISYVLFLCVDAFSGTQQKDARITVKAIQVDKVHTVEFHHNGPQIPSSQELFPLGLNAGTGRGKSSVVGLFVAHTIAQLNGGRLLMRNAEEGGVLISLLLPAEIATPTV